MKKTILLAAMAACLFATNVFAQKIKGSDTCLPLTQTEAENFMNKNKAAKITVTGGGSGVGISALMEGTTDIAMASRKMKFDERMKLQEAGKKTKRGGDRLRRSGCCRASFQQGIQSDPGAIGRHFYRQDQELERSGWCGYEDRGLFPRDFFRNLRVLQGERVEK